MYIFISLLEEDQQEARKSYLHHGRHSAVPATQSRSLGRRNNQLPPAGLVVGGHMAEADIPVDIEAEVLAIRFVCTGEVPSIGFRKRAAHRGPCDVGHYSSCKRRRIVS
jgi:hypothetical protein